MAGERALNRYADALYEAAEAADLEQRVGEELADLAELWERSPELSDFLTHPLVPTNAKEAFIREALGGKLHPYLINTLRLMARRGRAAHFPAVRSAFLRAAEEHGRLVRAVLRTARPLSTQQVDVIKARLGEVTGRTVVLEIISQPDLLAGAELEVAGRRLDASLERRLARLAEELKG